MFCKCGSELPAPRIKLGYKSCVSCSTEARWTVVPVNYHKTGNTAEIIKDPEVAADFLFMSSRKGFGVMRGLTSNRRQPQERAPRKTREIIIPAARFYEEVGKEALDLVESAGVKKAHAYVRKALRENKLQRKQAEKIINIINILTQNETR